MMNLTTSTAPAFARVPARLAGAAAVAALAIGALAGCAGGGSAGASAEPTASAAATASTSTSSGTGADAMGGAVVETGIPGLTIVDPWAKATTGMMTGTFGTLRNDTDADLKVAKIEVPGAGMVEQHETVVQQDGSSMMQEVGGGFTIPAHGQLELKPGADHIMLMQLEKPLAAGEELPITITFADGQVATYQAVVKEYTGAQESYAPSHTDMPSHSDMHTP
ncbi:hypothetical protein USB125703_01201 [Pseudoclavibacter triregionum]|nr:hypothetical protein USB125703_01201 [Pseudoclavibacter triregionum]